MRNICLFVGFVDKNNINVYGISFTGVMTRRNIYAKRTSTTGCLDYVEYVKIARGDTKDTTKQWRSIWKTTFRNINVSDDVGMDDSRITINPELSDEIKAAINDAIAEENAAIKQSFMRKAV